MISKEKVLPQYIENEITRYKRIKGLLKRSEGTISVTGNITVSPFKLGRSGLERIQWGIWRDVLRFGISPIETNKKLGEIIKAPFA